MSFAWAGDLQIWAALLTLTAIEIVLGIDNVILVSVLANRLAQHSQAQARRLGLILALATRLALLAGIVWVTKLTAPVLEGFGHRLSARDVILIAGGVFLVYSGTREIHAHIEGAEPNRQRPSASASFARIVAQMVMLDLVFSLDSIITAVGMANEFWVMAAAIVIAMAVMLAMAEPVAGFISRRPTVKVLVLSFLLLIGTALVADGFGFHVPRAYIYAAIGFSIGVEALNQLAGRSRGRDNDRSTG
ncbi:MAG TPA: TerC family protein [Xanthobacteraceae bacterium]|nr:TerC family protein [Xanthobacteraceae bacterium]